MTEEYYGLNWVGKKQSYQDAHTETDKTFKALKEDSKNFDNTENILIKGDNLDALKLLKSDYTEKVKMIYIDPPYNTGKSNRVYKDNYSNKKDKHSGWLSFMYPRLLLAKDLLEDDGVIFIHIDEHENANLKLLCDEIFGEHNHLVTLYIQVRYPGKTLAEKNDYQKLIEQVLVYQKLNHKPYKETEEYGLEKFCWEINELSSGKKETIGGREVEIFYPGQYEIKKVESSINALKETWASGSVLKVNASGKYFGNYLAPRKEIDGLKVLYKVYGIGEDGLGYRYFTGPQKETATKGKFYSGVPTKKIEELESGSALREKPILNFYNFADAFGNCRHEGEIDFRGGKKPVEFIKTLLSHSTNDNDIILDFFAGSGTTGHATMQLNAEDDGNRKYILVQLPESIDPKKQKEAYNFVTNQLDKEPTIFEITAERLQRAGDKILKDNDKSKTSNDLSHLDTGFKIYEIINNTDHQ